MSHRPETDSGHHAGRAVTRDNHVVQRACCHGRVTVQRIALLCKAISTAGACSLNLLALPDAIGIDLEEPHMPIASFDHAAIPTARPEEMIEFYKRLGFTVVNEEAWREGKARAFAFAFGDSKINVHPPAVWQNTAFNMRGPAAVPGCGDFCFV